MPVQDIIRWLRSEPGGTRELADRLRAAIANPPRARRQEWIEGLQSAFSAFAAHVRRRMAEEEAGGYLQPVIKVRPSLAEAVEVLRHEHRELTRIMERIQSTVQQLAPWHNFLIRDCCKRIENLVCWVERHEEHENHLVTYVFTEGGRPGGVTTST